MKSIICSGIIMIRKIVIAPDSFKGCLSAADVAEACLRAVRSVAPGCEVVKLPVADGGEGTSRAVTEATGGNFVQCQVCDPLMRPVTATYGISPDGTTAYMEMAQASGIALLDADELNPMETTSFGTGQMILDAIRRGCRYIILGIGGSATTDAGTGMLQALGYRFLDGNGTPLGQGGKILSEIRAIDSSGVEPRLRSTRISVACDVNNPLYGPRGAACVFAPQKGADAEMVRLLDIGLRNFARIVTSSSLPRIDDFPGAGAAGGLGGALVSFLGADLRPGIDLVLDVTGFDTKLRGADIVITGEGKMDAQTCMGKAPWGVMKRAAQFGIPTIAIAGAVEDTEDLFAAGFTAVFCIQQGAVQPRQVMEPDTARRNITVTMAQILRTLNARCGSL